MAKNLKLMVSKLRELEGTVNYEGNVHAEVLQSRSPSMNFIYGNAHGLPRGYSELLYGPPKGGKSYIVNDRIGALHASDPEAIVVKFNTEFREKAQLTPAMIKAFGIDMDRYICWETNSPELIYDRIGKEVAAMCEAGLPIKLLVIDSINNIQGRRAMDQEGMMTQNRGDQAQTNQVGLQYILPLQRKFGMSLIVTCHLRAEQDAREQMRGHKTRPGVSFGVQHHCEYVCYIEPNRNKAGRTDIRGESYRDESRQDMTGEAEQTAHRCFVEMKDSSLGPKHRVGEFTLDYNRGIINQYEEVYKLGRAWGIIGHEKNSRTFTVGDRKWNNGEEAFLRDLEKDQELQQSILTELKRRDMAGYFEAADRAREEAIQKAQEQAEASPA